MLGIIPKSPARSRSAEQVESLITPDWSGGTLTTRSFAQFGIQRKDNGSAPSSVSKLFLLTANWKVEKAGCGPAEGIALRASDNQTISPVDRYRETCFDNLACEWKAPDTDDFVRFYENDFSVRRYRTIHPAGTTAHDYVPCAGTS